MLHNNTKGLLSPSLPIKKISSSASLNELQNKNSIDVVSENINIKTVLSLEGDKKITLSTPESLQTVMGGKSSYERASSFAEQHEMLQNVVDILQENIVENVDEIKQTDVQNYDNDAYKR